MRWPVQVLRDWLAPPSCEPLARTDEGAFAPIRRDLDTVMSDFDLLAGTGAGPGSLLPLRMGLAGLEVARVAEEAPATLAAMRAACRSCVHWRACARHLVLGDADATLDVYCRNTATLSTLAIDGGAPVGAPIDSAPIDGAIIERRAPDA